MYSGQMSAQSTVSINKNSPGHISRHKHHRQLSNSHIVRFCIFRRLLTAQTSLVVNLSKTKSCHPEVINIIKRWKLSLKTDVFILESLICCKMFWLEHQYWYQIISKIKHRNGHTFPIRYSKTTTRVFLHIFYYTYNYTEQWLSDSDKSRWSNSFGDNNRPGL